MAAYIKVIEDYASDQPWEWGKRDCIGLMFKVVNHFTGNSFNRSAYIPSNYSYNQACSWLAKRYTDPLTPYMNFLYHDAKLEECYNGGNIILVWGGKPIMSRDRQQVYPIEPVPGIIFRTDNGLHYAMMRNGLNQVSLYPDQVKTIKRYKLTGLQ